MRYFKQQLGFTLIEILIIIVIIGIISTIITVALEDNRIKARDSRRVQDVKLLHNTIEYYRRMHGSYPDYVTPGESLTDPDSGEYYLEVIPEPPGKTDVYCQTDTYSYTKQSGDNFTLDYCLGLGTEDFGPGNHTATKHSLSYDCGGQNPAQELVSGACVVDSNTYGVLHFDNAVENYAATSDEAVANQGGELVSSGKFGGGVYFDGTYGDDPGTDYNNIKFTESNNWTFGGNDFTIDFWFKGGQETHDYSVVMGKHADSWNSGDIYDWTIRITSPSHAWFPGSMYFFYTPDGTNVYHYIEMGEVSTEQYDHYALVRSGNTIYGFKNGSLIESEGIGDYPTFRDSANFYVKVGSPYNNFGSTVETRPTKAYYDEVRIVIGEAKWTSEFAPPNHPH